MTLTPYWEADGVALYLGDSRGVLRGMADASVDAVVTDPPYELGFMGRAWDASGIAYDVELWRECLRVLKPGGHLLAFGGTRTWHRLTVAVEDAGFEIRDCVADLTGQDAPGLVWTYGSGFPKSLDVSKAIDKAAGAEREVVGTANYPGREGRTNDQGAAPGDVYRLGMESAHLAKQVTAPATDNARAWDGWGTALKPAWEPIVVARKPLQGTVAANVLAHGVGGINVGATRVNPGTPVPGGGNGKGNVGGVMGPATGARPIVEPHTAGRWPANLVLTHSQSCVDGGQCADDCPARELDAQSGVRPGSHSQRELTPWVNRDAIYGGGIGNITPGVREGFNDSGGASRYFPTFRYESKASSAERPRLDDGTAHPTVKPLALMRWLVRLVTPPAGTVLDPFAGSGTTAEACIVEGFNCVLVELEESHADLIKARLSKAIQPSLFGGAA